MLESLPTPWLAAMVCLSRTLMLASIFMVVFFCRALYMTYFYGHRPCDRDLALYLPVMLAVGQLATQLTLFAQRRARNSIARVFFSVIGVTPGWVVIGWGLWMVTTSETCESTNPSLYHAMRDYIYGQVVLSILSTAFHMAGFAVVLSYFSILANRSSPGCEDAVRQLPHIPRHAEELFEHGAPMDCPICTGSFQDGAVVRTRCEHLFHEECLLRWCRNHTTCPLCREEVGPPQGV